MPPRVTGPTTDTNLLASRFVLTFANGTTSVFTDASGLSVTQEVVEVKQTGPKGQTVYFKVPGSTSYGDITLKRYMTTDKKFYEWIDAIRSGKKDQRTSGSIALYDSENTEIDRWNFENAWPKKWSATDLDAASDDAMVEEITLAVEFLERAKK